jgi:predicted Fe-Mo cluster-binding NifX family protein
MIIAMPMSRGRLAGHFTKAQRIGFFNEYHHLVTSFDNPALAGGCSAKKAMLNLIKEQKADIVMVQNIGERMLGKLLDAGISVSQGDNSLGIEQLLTSCSDVSLRLLNASEGRASLNHLKKDGCCGSTGGGCGCSGGAEPQPLLSKVAPDSGIESATQSVKVSYAGFRPIN